MNKTELVAAIADKAEISKKDSEKALKAFVDVVTEELKKGHKIQLVGFGTFETSERAAREGRNPSTGETMKIEACKAPKFKNLSNLIIFLHFLPIGDGVFSKKPRPQLNCTLLTHNFHIPKRTRSQQLPARTLI